MEENKKEKRGVSCIVLCVLIIMFFGTFFYIIFEKISDISRDIGADSVKINRRMDNIIIELQEIEGNIYSGVNSIIDKKFKNQKDFCRAQKNVDVSIFDELSKLYIKFFNGNISASDIDNLKDYKFDLEIYKKIDVLRDILLQKNFNGNTNIIYRDFINVKNHILNDDVYENFAPYIISKKISTLKINNEKNNKALDLLNKMESYVVLNNFSDAVSYLKNEEFIEFRSSFKEWGDVMGLFIRYQNLFFEIFSDIAEYLKSCDEVLEVKND